METKGCGAPAGQIVRNPNGPFGTTAAFSGYAFADVGIPHEEASTGTVRETPGMSEEPPSGSFAKRVSIMRQGEIG